MRFMYVVIAGVIVAVLAYVLLWHPDLSNGQTSTADSSYETATSGSINLSPSLDPMHASETAGDENGRPKELVSSIYDYGLEYRQKATSAAENLIQHYPRESYNRWSPTRVDPFSILNGSYLEESAMPKTISVTPFPDISFVADQTDYLILEESYSAIWRGKIRPLTHLQRADWYSVNAHADSRLSGAFVVLQTYFKKTCRNRIRGVMFAHSKLTILATRRLANLE